MNDSAPHKLTTIARHWLSCCRFDQAERTLREILAIEPTNAFAMSALSEALLELGDLASAMELAKGAVSEHPAYAGSHISLARVALAAKDPTSALKDAAAGHARGVDVLPVCRPLRRPRTTATNRH